MLAQEGDAHSSGQGRMGGSRPFRRKLRGRVGKQERRKRRGQNSWICAGTAGVTASLLLPYKHPQ